MLIVCSPAHLSPSILRAALPSHNSRIAGLLVRQNRLLHRPDPHPRLDHRRFALGNVPRKAFERYYSVSSSYRSQARRFSLLAVGTFLGGIALWFTVVAALSAWDSLYPRHFADWPEEIRKHLAQARNEIMLAEADEILPHLERAWEAARDPAVLGRAWHADSSIKFLSIAMWLSDQLERTGNDREAYRVLGNAADTYQYRRQRSPDGRSVNSFDSEEAKEKLCVISVFMKLTSLSEKHEPAVQGRWLAFAIREMSPLLPLCPGLRVEVYQLISEAERFAAIDPSFSGIAHQLGNNQPTSPTPTNSEVTEEAPSSDFAIPESEVDTEEEFLSLPSWYLPDIPSAIALPLKHVADFAEKHGDLILAYVVHNYALHTSSLRATLKNDPSLQEWDYRVHALEFLNYQTSFMFRHPDYTFHPENWCYPDLVFNDRTVVEALLETLRFIDDLEKKRTNLMKRRLADRYRFYGAVFALTEKNNAIFQEKVGELVEALRACQYSLELWELSRQPRSSEEIRDIQERIKRLKRRIAEGDTSIDPDLDPVILMRWKEMKKRSMDDTDPKDGGVAA